LKIAEWPTPKLCVADCVPDLDVPQPTEWERIGNEIISASIFARADFVSVREDVNSMVDEIDPRQPFLRVNILRWREIFRMIETPSSNVDLIGHFVVVLWRGKEAQFPCEVLGIHR
jgi:hypothetical protein